MSLHADAVGAVAAYAPYDPDQASLREAYLRHLAAYPDGVWRSCAPAHLTASVLVADEPSERVLLALHRKARMWLQMGGHCEVGDPTLADAALREATEESGISGLRLLPGPVALDRHPAPCGVEAHLDVQYVAVAPSDAFPQASEESLDVRWFPVNALPEPTDDALRRLVARMLALR